MKQRLTAYLTNPLFLLPAFLIGLSIYVRLRYLDVPLERDEGEYAYMGQLLLDGVPPYLHAYTMKLPGVAMMYALSMELFGQTPTGIHLGLLIVNLLTTALVYALGKRIFNSETAAVAAGYHALISLSENVMGVFAHATHFVNLFLLAGFLLLLMAEEKGKLQMSFGSGLCFGLAILMKQHAAIMIPFALLLLARFGRTAGILRNITILLTGIMLPYLLVCIWMLSAGTFEKFWFWTVQYAAAYSSERSFLTALHTFWHEYSPEMFHQITIWMLATAGTVYLMLRKSFKYEARIHLLSLLIASLLMTCPGFIFRPHYFVLTLPAVSLLAGLATIKAHKLPGIPYAQMLPTLILTLAILLGVGAEGDYLFGYTPNQVSRVMYGANPFPEAKVIGDYLRKNSSVNDHIAILGSEPEILFYANRQSATGHIYMYGLMEKQKYGERMQAELIAEIEAANPLYLVVVHNSASWLLRSDTPNNILAWGDDYISLRYDEVGIIESYSDKPGKFLWDSEALGRNPDSDYFVSVFRRRW